MLNLTYNIATPEQFDAGMVEPFQKRLIKQLLTFTYVPDKIELNRRAVEIARIAKETGEKTAMIYGAEFFIDKLETQLKRKDIKPYTKAQVNEMIKQGVSLCK